MAFKCIPTKFIINSKSLILFILLILSGTNLLVASAISKSFQTDNTYAYRKTGQPMPSPDLLPQQVVAIQIKALKENDIYDKGIAVTFNFATPENKAFTGPLDRFKQLVKNATYRPLLNAKKYEPNKIHIEGNEAQQIIIVTDKNGNKAAFLFSLSKQLKGPYQGCWMTDSVRRLAYEEKIIKV